jgi:hypothetical protein
MGGNAARDVDNWDMNINDASTVPPAGNYRLLVFADYDESISEDDENNNTLYISPQGSDLTFTPAGSTGVNDLNAALTGVMSFPNPAQGTTTLMIGLRSSTTGSVTISDLQGRVVSELLAPGSKMEAGNKSIRIETASLTPGIYFCNVSTAQGSLTHKLVIR